MEHTEHQNGAAIVVILKGVRSTEHLENELAVLVAITYGSPQLRMPTKNVSSGNEFAADECGELGELLVQERGKSIEIGECVDATTRSLLARPLSETRRAPRSQPLHHTLVWHPRAFRGPGISAIKLRNLVSVCVPRGAVECRKFRDQLWNRHAELGRSDLEHLRGLLVDLDVDVGTHATRIADPEPSGQCAGATNVVRFQTAVIATTTCKSLKLLEEMLVTQIFTSWNRMGEWLRQIDGLRNTA